MGVPGYPQVSAFTEAGTLIIVAAQHVRLAGHITHAAHVQRKQKLRTARPNYAVAQLLTPWPSSAPLIALQPGMVPNNFMGMPGGFPGNYSGK